jgi:hypothetical protein
MGLACGGPPQQTATAKPITANCQECPGTGQSGDAVNCRLELLGSRRRLRRRGLRAALARRPRPPCVGPGGRGQHVPLPRRAYASRCKSALTATEVAAQELRFTDG